MPVIDLSITISAIVALCAIVSPVITTAINNRHQRVMRELEYKHQKEQDKIAHEKEIYEGYVRSAGGCIQSSTAEALREFGSCSNLTAYYVTDDIRADILKLEKIMLHSDNRAEKIDLLASIAIKLRMLQEKS